MPLSVASVQPTPSTLGQHVSPARPGPGRQLAIGSAVLGSIILTRAVHRRLSAKRGGRAASASRLQVSPLVVDAMCGAIGEIAQIGLLYPLDTIKVKCQAQGAGMATVIRQFYAMGMRKSTLKALYAGMGPSALCSCFIGAVYLVHHDHSSFAGEPHSLHLAVPELADGEAEAVGANSTAWVATLSAFVSSIVTSTFEAPVELFRHRLQAGFVGGNMLGNMRSALSAGGVSSLYWNYSPFLLKAIPYDVAELFTYSQISEMQRNAREKGAAPQGLAALMQQVPQEMMDMLIGAFAGATAVIMSMPSDCIKTRIEMSAVAPPKGLVPGARNFMAVGRGLVAANGPKSLFVGLVPRLAEKVPSTMVYWLAVEGCRRALAPYVIGASPEALHTALQAA
ncbi:hypothetical protein WJX72_010841 [[Myrmecia] bisecta]|uniref:Mitochondrial carrier protein n=1 Tax=[Myrmecia] bisecta TaxID=41462 RepID=A0AAW1PH73_9CHLO